MITLINNLINNNSILNLKISLKVDQLLVNKNNQRDGTTLINF